MIGSLSKKKGKIKMKKQNDHGKKLPRQENKSSIIYFLWKRKLWEIATRFGCIFEDLSTFMENSICFNEPFPVVHNNVLFPLYFVNLFYLSFPNVSHYYFLSNIPFTELLPFHNNFLFPITSTSTKCHFGEFSIWKNCTYAGVYAIIDAYIL